MKYRNNLSEVSENSFFEVVFSFPVYIPVGIYASNSFVGSFQMLGCMYRKIDLQPGDQLYDTFGGVFVKHNGTFSSAKTELSDRPFEKTYAGEIELFPTDNLRKIAAPQNLEIKHQELPTISHPKKCYGRGIDSIESDQ